LNVYVAEMQESAQIGCESKGIIDNKKASN